MIRLLNKLFHINICILIFINLNIFILANQIYIEDTKPANTRGNTLLSIYIYIYILLIDIIYIME